MAERITFNNFSEFQGGLTASPESGVLVFKIYPKEGENLGEPLYLLPDTYSELCQRLLVNKEQNPKGVTLSTELPSINMPEPGLVAEITSD